MPALRDRLPRLARDSQQQLSPRWDYGTDFRDSVGVWLRHRPPPPRADRGGVAAPAAGRGGCPAALEARGQALEAAATAVRRPRRAVDNFAHLRVLWIAAKSLISFITYAQLTKKTSHDIHYVKSEPLPDACFAAFMCSEMRESSICGQLRRHICG